LGKGLPDK